MPDPRTSSSGLVMNSCQEIRNAISTNADYRCGGAR